MIKITFVETSFYDSSSFLTSINPDNFYQPEVKTTEIEEVKEERVIVPEVVVQEQPKVEAEIEENNVPEVKEVEKTKVTEVEKTKVTEVEKTKVTEVENTVVPDSPQLREKTVKG